MNRIGIIALIALVLISAPVSALTYDQMARYPDQYAGEQVTITGEVIQVQEVEEGKFVVRLSTKKNSWGYGGDDLLISLRLDSTAGKVLEEDIIRVTGMFVGPFTYTTFMGSSRTVPSIYGDTYTITN